MLRLGRRPFLAIIGALASGRAGAAVGSAFIDRGRSEFAITVRPGSPGAAVFGALELQKILEQATGARLPIASPRDVATRRFNAWLTIGAAPLPDEAYRVRVHPARVDIEGGGARGILHGCYGFLEELVGCRWYTSTISRIPNRTTLRFGEGELVDAPAFRYREVYTREALDRTWAVRNRLNGAFLELPESMGGGVEYAGRLEAGAFAHTFAQLLPPQLFDAHPEWFGQRAGRRRRDAQPCLTNPAVLAAITAAARAWLVANPRASVVSISQNDDYEFCECGPCTVAMKRFGAASGLVLAFVNAVAADVARDHPRVVIETLAYQWTEAPPSNRPGPNVRVLFAALGRCFSHGLDECERNSAIAGRLRGWTALGGDVHVWHYGTNLASFFRPLPDFDALSADLGALRLRGVTGVFVEGSYPRGGGGDMAELRAYILARLLWNPGRAVWPLIDEFVDAVFAEAAPFVASWLRALHDEVRGASVHAGVFDGPRAAYFSAHLLERGAHLFDAAESAVRDAGALRRVEGARLPLDMTRAERMLSCDPARAALLRKIEERLRSRKIQFVSEAESVDAWLERLRAEAG